MPTNELRTRPVALVTGAAGGIGLAICKTLADSGHRVVGWDLKEWDWTPPSKVAAELWTVDVSSEQSVMWGAERLSRESVDVAVLVNNAGILGAKVSVKESTLKEWERVISVNLTSAFLCTRAIVGGMITRRHGRIVNISSLGAQTGARFASAAYTASKGGLLSFTKTAARELAGYGVTVNAIAPARIDGPIFWEAEGEGGSESAASVPVSRLGTPADVAAAVLFLASEEASFITGHTLNVNGGVWMS